MIFLYSDNLIKRIILLICMLGIFDVAHASGKEVTRKDTLDLLCKMDNQAIFEKKMGYAGMLAKAKNLGDFGKGFPKTVEIHQWPMKGGSILILSNAVGTPLRVAFTKDQDRSIYGETCKDVQGSTVNKVSAYIEKHAVEITNSLSKKLNKTATKIDRELDAQENVSSTYWHDFTMKKVLRTEKQVSLIESFYRDHKDEYLKGSEIPATCSLAKQYKQEAYASANLDFFATATMYSKLAPLFIVKHISPKVSARLVLDLIMLSSSNGVTDCGDGITREALGRIMSARRRM